MAARSGGAGVDGSGDFSLDCGLGIKTMHNPRIFKKTGQTKA